MAAALKKRVRVPWGWYRTFGRIGAATWSWSKVEIDHELALGLCNPMSVVQRVLSASP